MVEIIERDGGTKIKTFKSNRDEIISNDIPKDCGMCRESAVYFVCGSPGSGKSMLMESIMQKQLKGHSMTSTFAAHVVVEVVIQNHIRNK